MLPKMLLGMLLAVSSIIAPAQAASYPTKPVRMIVVYGPGSGPDISIRIYANYLQKKTGQPFVVENKLGAGGIIAIEEVHRSAADGYTILVGDVSANAFIPALSAAESLLRHVAGSDPADPALGSQDLAANGNDQLPADHDQGNGRMEQEERPDRRRLRRHRHLQSSRHGGARQGRGLFAETHSVR